MASRLTAISFTKDDLYTVADFDCGSLPWAQQLAGWIQGKPNGVIESMDRGTQVWLYLNDHDEVVGFGSLGTTTWYYPDPYGNVSDTKVELCIIPAYAISSRFQGTPGTHWTEHYSTEIMVDLISQAVKYCLSHPSMVPLLGLFVHEQNIKAIRHYTNHGFALYGKPLKKSGQRMLLNLPVDVPK